MTQKLTERRHILFFTALCWLVYLVSYITRINYGASIAQILEAASLTKSMAGAITTGSFIAYGVGQVLCGFLGDKLSPQKMIFTGLLGTALCNLLLPLVPNGGLMLCVWCVNGLFQSMMWPPLVRIMAAALSPEDYSHSIVHIVVASYIGTILVYLLAPLCIFLSGWELTFFVSAGIGLLMAFVWALGLRRLPVGRPAPVKAQPAASNEKLPVQALLLPLLPVALAIMMEGMLRDGVTTWMPTYLTDVFHLGASVSILTVVVLPLSSIVCVKLASLLFARLQRELRASAVVFGVGLCAAAVLIPLFGKSAWLSIFFMAVLTGCMQGIGMLLTGYLPVRFARFGKVAFVSGLFNAFAYVGSAASSFGIAVLSEQMGWQFTISSWAVIALLGMLFCCVGGVLLKKNKHFY